MGLQKVITPVTPSVAISMERDASTEYPAS
jgi:hypothetical protein